jgi:hypothetical protein
MRVGAGDIPVPLLDTAKAYLKGLTPVHYLDFTTNRAIWNQRDIGAIASVPGLTGTLDLSSSGHLIDGADNQLSISSPGIAATHTMFIEFRRAVDTGAVEYLLRAFASANERSNLYLSATDLLQFTPVAAGAAVADITVAGAIATAAVTKGAARTALNSFNVANNGTAGTLDTAGALPSVCTSLEIGHSGGTATFAGHIRRVAIFNAALTDAQLQAITT